MVVSDYILTLTVIILLALSFGAGWYFARRKFSRAHLPEDKKLIDFMIDSVDRLPDGVARFDAEERLVYCNSTYRDLNEIIADLCVPGTSFETLARGKVTRDWQGGEKGMTQEEYIAERVATFRGGQREWLEQYEDGTWVLARDHPTDDGGRVCLRLDITERKNAEDRVRHLANHDPLTGLPSLNLAQENLQIAIKMADRHKWQFAVFFIDLDGFKSVNDSFGHQCGDKLLQQVAKRLTGCLRQSDTVARIGGDEFLVILNEIKLITDCADIASKIISELSRPFIAEEGIAQIGASLGIAIYPKDAQDANALIKAADKTMYEVKFSSKNAYRFAG